MTEDEAKPYAKPLPYWVPDTRTVIVCWMMVSSFFIIFLCWLSPPDGAESQLLNTLIGMYVGTGFIGAINWWTGDAKGSDTNNKLKDEMSKAVSANAGVLPTPAVTTPWWNMLTEAERTAITSSTDQRVIDFVKAPVTIKPLPDDLAYLVSQGLLTQARATEIQSA